MYSLTGFETYLVYWSPANSGRLEVEATVANAPTPQVIDPLTGQSRPADRLQAGPQTTRSALRCRFRIIRSSSTSISATAALLSPTVDVRQERQPRVGGNHLRATSKRRRRRTRRCSTYIAHVRIEQHFHPSAADPAYNIITENRLFFGARRRRVGGAELRAERRELDDQSSAVPARAAGEGAVAAARSSAEPGLRLPPRRRRRRSTGATAYVVRFDPIDRRRALYRGTVWIDRTTFVRLKVQAVETNLSGTDRVQRRDAVVRAVRRDRRPAGVAGQAAVEQADFPDRRTDRADRAGGQRCQRHRAEPVRLRPGTRAVGAREQPHHVPRHRSGPALSGQARRDAGRQRQDDHVGEGVRDSGADIDPSFDYPLPIGGLNYPRLQLPERNYAARAAVRRRHRAGQRAARQPVGRQVRRERRFLRAGAQGQRRSSSTPTASEAPSASIAFRWRSGSTSASR